MASGGLYSSKYITIYSHIIERGTIYQWDIIYANFVILATPVLNIMTLCTPRVNN